MNFNQQQWKQYQMDHSYKVLTNDSLQLPIKYIGGIDVSFADQSDDVKIYEAVGALVILDFATLKVVYSDFYEMSTEIPYIPGFLGFREEPFAKILFERLYKNQPNLIPQILLVDGCGIYHPRNFGSACQIGISLDIPTIGISKSFLKLEGLEENDFIVKNLDVDIKPFDLEVRPKNGEILAVAIYSGSSKYPNLYVSIGHKISLRSAVEIVKKCSISKIPEPIRKADLLSREIIRKKY